MRQRSTRLAALAAALDPRGAPGLLARLAAPEGAAEAERLSGLPRRARLEALAGALGPRAGAGLGGERPSLCAALARPIPADPSPADRILWRVARHLEGSGAGDGTRVRAPDAGPVPDAPRAAGAPTARSVNEEGPMLPWEMPSVGRGRCEVDEAARSLGDRACRGAAEAVQAALGLEARISGRPLPAGASPGAVAELPIELLALPGQATLAVECSFAAGLADRLAGGTQGTWLAASLTPAESAVLDLAVLAGLQGVSRLDLVEQSLCPRLGSGAGHVEDPLLVDLALSLGGLEGRALLALPAAALRALRGPPELPARLEGLEVEASVRSGSSRLHPAEVRALDAGDVVLLEERCGTEAALELPGGARARGRITGDSFEVEEVEMAKVSAASAGLPLLVEVELGRVAVTLADLARVEPGAVLPLGLARRGLVTLRVGGRELAEGELVDVDGAVGVRVLRLGAPA